MDKLRLFFALFVLILLGVGYLSLTQYGDVMQAGIFHGKGLQNVANFSQVFPARLKGMGASWAKEVSPDLTSACQAEVGSQSFCRIEE